jgi:hypothetical protein
VYNPLLALFRGRDDHAQKNGYFPSNPPIAYLHLRSNRMETLLSHCAGMDVHQESIVVCAITGDAGDSPSIDTRTFSTMTKSLFELIDHYELAR